MRSATPSHLIGRVAGKVTKLKQREGGPILVAGSQTLVHFLIEDASTSDSGVVVNTCRSV